jgi:hypothetical protein
VKWAVELLGEDFDVQDARTLFTSGTARIETIEGNATVLVADDFESLTAVRFRSGRCARIVTAIGASTDTSEQKLSHYD